AGDILTHVGKREVSDADEFMLAVGSMGAGERVQLTWYHDARPVSRTVDLAKYPVQGAKVVTTPAPGWRGLRVDFVTILADQPDGGFPARGLGTEVEPERPAWQAGLRPDMLVSHVGGRAVHAPQEFFAAAERQTGPVKLRASQANGEPADCTVA